MIHSLYSYFLKQKAKENESYFFKWLRWRLFNYLKSGLMRHYRKLPLTNLKTATSSHVIVSLTSIPTRINTVHLVIKSMLNQSYKPSKVVLWLGIEHFPNKEKNLPSVLLELKDIGLEIEFCEDLKPHTKYYYAFKKYPQKLVVTVDDDMFYSRDMLQKLLDFHERYPKAVIANRVREISYSNGNIDHYRKWKINSYVNSEPSEKLLATGVGGVLYQPSLFLEDLFEKDKIRELALNVDDIWLKANQLRNNISVVWTNCFYQSFIEISESQVTNLNSNNVFEGDNNIKIKKIFSYFRIDAASFE
jgi:hypothetical protein